MTWSPHLTPVLSFNLLLNCYFFFTLRQKLRASFCSANISNSFTHHTCSVLSWLKCFLHDLPVFSHLNVKFPERPILTSVILPFSYFRYTWRSLFPFHPKIDYSKCSFLYMLMGVLPSKMFIAVTTAHSIVPASQTGKKTHETQVQDSTCIMLRHCIPLRKKWQYEKWDGRDKAKLIVIYDSRQKSQSREH